MVEELNIGITFWWLLLKRVADVILDIKDKKDFGPICVLILKNAVMILVAEKLPEIFLVSCFKINMNRQENWNFTKVSKLIFCQLICDAGTCLFVVLFYSPESETLLQVSMERLCCLLDSLRS